MSDTTGGDGAVEHDQHLTVEDAGTTTDPADLVDDDATRTAPAEADGDPGHVFDQTNGVVDDLDGDSDGTAESDLLSRADRGQDDPTFDDAQVLGDDDGVDDLRDPNP